MWLTNSNLANTVITIIYCNDKIKYRIVLTIKSFLDFNPSHMLYAPKFLGYT